MKLYWLASSAQWYDIIPDSILNNMECHRNAVHAQTVVTRPPSPRMAWVRLGVMCYGVCGMGMFRGGWMQWMWIRLWSM